MKGRPGVPPGSWLSRKVLRHQVRMVHAPPMRCACLDIPDQRQAPCGWALHPASLVLS